MATQTEVAAHLDLTQSAVSQLIAARILPASAGRGGLDIDECRVSYVRHLREVAAGRQAAAKGDGLDLVAERARLAKEQADGLAMKNAITRGQMIPAEAAVRVVGESCSTIRTHFLAMPSNAAPRLFRCKSIAELQEMLMGLVVQALAELSIGFERLANPGEHDEPAGDDTSGRDGGGPGAEDGGGNPGRSGRAKSLGDRSARS